MMVVNSSIGLIEDEGVPLRPSPEPSYCDARGIVDCPACTGGGTGCRTCKGTGMLDQSTGEAPVLATHCYCDMDFVCSYPPCIRADRDDQAYWGARIPKGFWRL